MNGTDTDDALIGAEVPGCGVIELHDMVMENDVMMMQQVEGWTVAVDPKLLETKNTEIVEPAIVALANHLQRIAILIPEQALQKLRTMEIWIEFDHPQLKAMQYHPSRGWLLANGRATADAGAGAAARADGARVPERFQHRPPAHRGPRRRRH